MDPGLLRGRGRLPDRQPRPARRGLRGDRGQGAASSARSSATSSTPASASPTEFVAPAIKANALYGGGYPLFTALGRPLIAELAVEYARSSGCDTIAHGCTGKGNDQVRIEATVATLAPELKTIAPVRSWQMGREEEIAYAREHGIPVKGGTEVAPYSIDDNLWGRSSEGRWIEDLEHAPEDDVFQLVTRPEQAPDEAETVTVGFEAGVPVSLDGERLGLVELLEAAAEIGCRHGVGIVDHIEDRIVGLKVRDIYEVPAAAIVLTAHQELEKLVGTIHQNQFKPGLDQKWGYLVYAGLWWEPLRADLDAYMDAVNAQVTGEIGLRLYKGACASSPAPRPTPSTTPTWPPSPSPAASSRRPPRRASSSSGRCSRGWRTRSGSATGGGGLMYDKARQGRGALRLRLPAPPLPARDPHRHRRRGASRSAPPSTSPTATSPRAERRSRKFRCGYGQLVRMR